MEAAKSDKNLVPLPSTERGYGIHLYATDKGDKMIYAANHQVIIRSFSDPSDAVSFDGHHTRVCCAKFAPNGNWVASGDDKGRVLVWAVGNQAIKNEVQVCRKVLDVDWSEDSKRIVAVGEGGEKKARCFTWDSGNNLGEVGNHNKTILSVSFKPNRPYRLATTSEDNSVNIFQGPPFKFDKSFKEHERYPNDVRYSPNGEHFVTVGADSKIFLFDGKSGDKVKALESKDGHKGSIYAVCWSPDSSKILTCSADKTAKIWKVESSEVEATFTAGKDLGDMQVGCIWHKDWIVSVSLSGALNYWDPASPGQPKQVVHGHNSATTCMVVSQAGDAIYSSDNAGVITRWDTTTGLGTWFTGKGHGKGIVALAVAADDSAVYSVGLDDKIRRNDCKSNEFSDVAVSVGGSPLSVAAGSIDPDLAVVTIAQKSVTVVWKGAVTSTIDVQYKPSNVAISADDKLVAVAGGDNKVHLYALNNGKLSEGKTLDHEHPVNCVSFSRNGQLLAAGDNDMQTLVWDVNSHKKLNQFGFKYHEAKVNCAAFNPSSDRLVSCSLDMHMYLWKDLVSFDEKQRHKFHVSHFGGVNYVRFLNDTTIASLGEDRVIKLWDTSKLN